MSQINPSWLLLSAILFALLPIALGLTTAYIKVSVVLGMVRNALGTQQVPSTLVIMALSIAITGFTMSAVIEETMLRAQDVSFKDFDKINSLKELAPLVKIFEPWKEFLSQHAGNREIAVLTALAEFKSVDNSIEKKEIVPNAQEASQTPIRVLIPAFVLTELKEGFSMAFVLLLPFLVIDLVVANILAGMGMFMVSPAMISLPLKMILFVVSDGWLLLAKGLIHSYHI